MATSGMLDQKTLKEKIEQLSTDIALLNRVVHGDVTETVPLGDIDTPTIRKLMADIDARESEAARKALLEQIAVCNQIVQRAENILINIGERVEGQIYGEYSIPITKANGEVTVVLRDIGHPEMKTRFNPIINIIASDPYTHTLKSKSLTDFTIQIYDGNGEKRVPMAESVTFGDFAFGDNTVFGQEGMGSNVALAVSIPFPNGTDPDSMADGGDMTV